MKEFEIELDAQVTITKRVKSETQEEAVSDAIVDLQLDFPAGDVYNARLISVAEV